MTVLEAELVEIKARLAWLEAIVARWVSMLLDTHEWSRLRCDLSSGHGYLRLMATRTIGRPSSSCRRRAGCDLHLNYHTRRAALRRRMLAASG